MMKDFNANSRTLVVSFVIAVMFLIPLRFVELGNQMTAATAPQVLGVETENVVLPSAEVNVAAPVLEEPYATIEANCAQELKLLAKLKNGNLTQKQTDEVVAQIAKLDKTGCKE